MDFRIKKSKKALTAILIATREGERQLPFFTVIEKIFDSLEEIFSCRSLAMLENLAELLGKISGNVKEFNDIVAQLNGADHSLLPDEEVEKLTERLREIIELKT